MGLLFGVIEDCVFQFGLIISYWDVLRIRFQVVVEDVEMEIEWILCEVIKLQNVRFGGNVRGIYFYGFGN